MICKIMKYKITTQLLKKKKLENKIIYLIFTRLQLYSNKKYECKYEVIFSPLTTFLLFFAVIKNLFLFVIHIDLKRLSDSTDRKAKNVCERARIEKDRRCVGERAEMSPRNEHLAIYHAMPPRFTIQTSYLTF